MDRQQRSTTNTFHVPVSRCRIVLDLCHTKHTASKTGSVSALLLSLACCSFKRPYFLDRGGNHAMLRSACAHDHAPDNSTPFSCTVLVPVDFHTLQLHEFRWNSNSTNQRNTIKERLEDSPSPNKFVHCDINLPCSHNLGWCTGNTGPDWK